ncbi:hypothetical protein SCUCBS95973_004778 [Sporothrix curviconia]|uniref:Beta-lactamase-related domain-containing protein n=1 Tax=Sporothrix curviconia TaxID=1260050 RepID=A0ABP0BT47_9PEZI
MPLNEQILSNLRGIVDAACADPTTDIPGATVVVVDKSGNELFAHASGKRGLATDEAMTVENIFWIASCTKMLTGVAVMQLVEQGKLNLDDSAQIAKLVPELTSLTVLKKDGGTEPQKNAITLRMLLAHTAGFGYSFFNERLRDWDLAAGVSEFSGRFEDMKTPLLFQPGEGWEYGTNIDWAGVALERVTGLTLNDYMQKYILAPLGLANMNMIPTAEMRTKMVHCHSRGPDGVLRHRDHLHNAPLAVDLSNKEEISRIFCSGGAGMFAKPGEYAKVLAVLLNDGTCPRTGAKILRKETVDEMFKNQIPQFPNSSRQPIPAAIPELTNPIGELYPTAGNPPQGWGLTFMLANSDGTGRSVNTAHWAGLINAWWWCDRDNGVAGILCTQILPFADAKVLGLWVGVEAEVYKGLAQR